MSKQHSTQAALVTAQRRKREKEQRYRNILKTAERLFCEQGYPNTKIRDIAVASEVAVGTVYLHFRNKEDLLLQLLDRISFEFRSALGESLGDGKTPTERFENVGRTLSQDDFWLRIRPYVIILYRESVGISHAVQARRRGLIERIKEDLEGAILEIMKEHGHQDRYTADVVAVAIEGVFERIAYRYLIWDDRLDEIDGVVSKVMEFVGGGLLSVVNSLDRAEASEPQAKK
jgi:AcrR family transcriptional regulator